MKILFLQYLFQAFFVGSEFMIVSDPIQITICQKDIIKNYQFFYWSSQLINAKICNLSEII